MKPLYEINALIDEQLELIFNSVNEDGEITMSMDTLDELKMEREQKVENLGLVWKNLKAEEKALKEEEDNLKKRRYSVSKRIERLEAYISSQLNHDEKFKTPRVMLSFRHSYKVVIPDESKIAKTYLRVKTEVDKVAIRHAIDEGRRVTGASLEDNYSLQIK